MVMTVPEYARHFDMDLHKQPIGTRTVAQLVQQHQEIFTERTTS